METGLKMWILNSKDINRDFIIRLDAPFYHGLIGFAKFFDLVEHCQKKAALAVLRPTQVIRFSPFHHVRITLYRR